LLPKRLVIVAHARTVTARSAPTEPAR
jgi:hypothetical protein